jgi:hypothetical protein
MPKIVVPFTIAEEDVLTLGSTPVTIASFKTAPGLARVPVRLEIRKAAGTAYAFTDIVTPSDNLRDNFLEDARVGTYLVVRDSDARPFFYVKLEGFIDRTDSRGYLVFPELDSKSFEPGNTSFEIVATTALTVGTGAITGRLYLDEYPV